MHEIIFNGYSSFRNTISINRLFFLKFILVVIALLSTYFIQAQTKKETQEWILQKLNLAAAEQIFLSWGSDNHTFFWHRKRNTKNFQILNDTLLLEIENKYDNSELQYDDDAGLRKLYNCTCGICEQMRKDKNLKSYAVIPLADIDTVYQMTEVNGELGGKWSYWRGTSYADVSMIRIVCRTESIQYYGASSNRVRTTMITLKLLKEKDLWMRLEKAFTHLKKMYPPKKETF
jgi:hypothetical protein